MNLVGVDDTGNVGVGNFTVRKSVALLLDSRLGVSSEDSVELLEGTFSPDDKTTNVTSWGQLKKVQSADMSNLNSWNVSKSLDERNISSTVDNKRSSARSVSSISQLTLSSSNLDSVDDLLDISPGTSVSKESNSLFSAFDFLSSVANNKR